MELWATQEGKEISHAYDAQSCMYAFGAGGVSASVGKRARTRSSQGGRMSPTPPHQNLEMAGHIVVFTLGGGALLSSG